MKTFLLKFIDEHYKALESCFALTMGVLPTIVAFLHKYGLNWEHYAFGVVGQFFMIYINYSKSAKRDKKTPFDLVTSFMHLCMGGLFSLFLTNYFTGLLRITDNFNTIMLIAIFLGAFYDAFVKTIVDLVNWAKPVALERLKKAVTVFFNINTDEKKEDSNIDK